MRLINCYVSKGSWKGAKKCACVLDTDILTFQMSGRYNQRIVGGLFSEMSYDERLSLALKYSPPREICGNSLLQCGVWGISLAPKLGSKSFSKNILKNLSQGQFCAVHTKIVQITIGPRSVERTKPHWLLLNLIGHFNILHENGCLDFCANFSESSA